MGRQPLRQAKRVDHGRPIEFGYSIIPIAGEYPSLAETARLADELGFDLLGIQDHPYQWRFLDTWTLISVLAAQTSRIRLFPDVANLPLRPPAVLAKAVASLDVISGGRAELGLGAGSFWQAIGAMGGPVREPADSISALEEAIQVARLIWSGERELRFDGRFYSLNGVNSGPRPLHNVEIWLGVYRPRGLALTGRLADGWLPSAGRMTLSDLAERQSRIDSAAAEAGRQPNEVRRLYNIGGRVTEDELTELALGYGMDTFILWFDGDVQAELRRFAAEVAPAVRRNVAQARG
jgi:alkanesulfonate monooxygenase SsuD/methylene tetrahydromethanopterin reductase-like flavin-dependent oxidoreductase (luciferase family)